ARSVSCQTGAKPAATNSVLWARRGISSAVASRTTMSRLGAARPNSKKLRCRCEMSARPASASCDQPRRCRHQRSLAAKPCPRGMTTCQVVAQTLLDVKIAHPAHTRQEAALGERAGVAIAIVSSSLGGTAAAVTRYLVGDADALTLAILRWGIGFL